MCAVRVSCDNKMSDCAPATVLLARLGVGEVGTQHRSEKLVKLVAVGGACEAVAEETAGLVGEHLEHEVARVWVRMRAREVVAQETQTPVGQIARGEQVVCKVILQWQKISGKICGAAHFICDCANHECVNLIHFRNVNGPDFCGPARFAFQTFRPASASCKNSIKVLEKIYKKFQINY